MNERLRRLFAIIRADLLIRFRRPSTIVVFLLLSAFAYVWVPDPATGKALLQIDGKRALYNSAAIGMATASLAAIFIGLAGFYVISNAIRRDVLSRCGFVIASTTMRGGEYLVGKVAGNVVFLTTFVAGFMVTSMAMLVVRGEAPLQPLVFAKQYLLLVPPVIVFVSVIAIVFESIPFLSGKFGDVAYFFLWIGSLGVVASNVTANDPGVFGYFDISGFGYMRAGLGTDSVAIGSSPFDASKGLFLFEGLKLPRAWVASRVVSTVVSLAFLPLGLLFFHRFDPARIRQSLQRGARGWVARLSLLAKPVSRIAYGIAARGGKVSLLSAARHDALMAMTSFPATILIVIGLAIAALVSASGREVMPVAFAVAAVLIADLSSREKRAGTLPLVYSAPMLRSSFVWWKFGAAFLLSTAVLFVPALRLLASSPRAAVALLVALVVGVAFVAATATALGVMSSNGKTFIVVFLTFWYVVVSDNGQSAGLDFAGFHGKATPMVTLAYAGIAVVALAIAQAFYMARLRRAW